MPLYKVRNVLEAGGIKAFWKIEAGVTRGSVPGDQGPSQEQSKERIKKLQQELHAARQEVTTKNRELSRLQRQQKQGNVNQKPAGKPKNGTKPQDPTAEIPIPPEDLDTVVKARDARSYMKLGESLKTKLLQYTDVTSTSSILDIGAGPGRVARAFVDFMEPPGRYVGMDIEKPNMDWCEANISPENPAFSFFHQDVYNGMYNPQGKYRASEYRFPFEDESFDLIFLTSVFTHLVPEDAQNYLNEISRLLKPDGVCFSTWFLLGRDLKVKYMGAHSREARVGYGFHHSLQMLEDSGLTLAREPVLGRWHGVTSDTESQNPVGNQDLLLLEHASSEESSLISRYEAPNLHGSDTSELKDITGTIKMFDPISSSIIINDSAEEKAFKVPVDAELKINSRRVDSAVLRQGQEATIRFAREGQQGVARTIHVEDQPRKITDRMRRTAGTLEALDRERGLITLIVGNNVRTFEFDPQRVEMLSGKDRGKIEDLRLGQGVAVEQVDGKDTLHSLG